MKSFAGVFDLLTPNRLHTDFPKKLTNTFFRQHFPRDEGNTGKFGIQLLPCVSGDGSPAT